MKLSMIRVLLLGIGRWGANHLRVLQSLPVELCAADTDPKRLEQARSLGLKGAQLSTDPDRFADAVDAAVVVTPAHTHFPLCQQLLQAGKDVFVEKPLALRAEEGRALAALAERGGRILQVGHIFRYDPAARWLREAIARGTFGRVRMLRGNFSGFKRPRNDSGVMLADAIHFVDLFNFFMGRLPRRVTALAKDFLARGMEDESFIAMDYDGANGTTWATVQTGCFSPGKFREVMVVGSELSAVCDFSQAQDKIKTFRNKHVASGREFKAVEGEAHQLELPPEEPLRAELRAFLESVETRQPPLADARAGFEAVQVLEAARESVETGRTVTLTEPRRPK